MAIYKSVTELIGNTPLTELCGFEKKHGLNAKILAKLEYFNPAGSVKDRVAASMIQDAEEKGLITSDTVIIEPTSGNTGIGLASICASKGYRLILTMPETMSVERRNLLKAYGAEIVLTPGKEGMSGAVRAADELKGKFEKSFIPNQFENAANPAAHIKTTAPEILADCKNPDFLVAGVGTGGTITGVGGYLKSKVPGLKVVAVEPAGSPLLSKGVAGPHKIQGIGANFVPKVLDKKIIDEIITVSDEDAFAFGREVGTCEGFLIGISSGAALCAATQIAKRPENAGKTIVVIFPDGADRYFSTPLITG